MQCVVDILDTFKLIRAQQSYCDVPIPAMYEVIPWLFEATELPKQVKNTLPDKINHIDFIIALLR